MNVSDVASRLVEMALPNVADGEEKKRGLTEHKIYHFVNQNQEKFKATDVGALMDLRKRAVLVGEERSRTVELIDNVIQKFDPAVQQLQERVIRDYNSLMVDVRYHDPARLRYEADSLWAQREKGVYPALMQNGVLQTVVYSLYQAAANLAKEQLGPEAAEELKQLGYNVLAEIPPDAHTPSYKDYEQFLKQFVAGEKRPFNIAQAHLFFERHTSRFTDHPLHNQKLYRESQRILTAAGLPSNALATRLQILARDQTTRTAQLPYTALEKLGAKIFIPLLEADSHLMKEITPAKAVELIKEASQEGVPIKPELRYALTLLMGDKAQEVDLSGYSDLTDGKLKKLMESCPNLTRLNLSGCQHLTGKGIQEIVRQAPGLNSLNLSNCTALTEEVLFPLSALTQLESLDLAGLRISSRLLTSLITLQSLTALSLANTPITDEALLPLRSLAQIAHVNLSGCRKLTDTGIITLPPLVSLALDEIPELTVKTIQHLKVMKDLTHLSLAKCGKSADRFVSIVPKVEELSFISALSKEMLGLDSFPSLQVLNVSRNEVEKADEIEALYDIRTLSEIYVTQMNVNPPDTRRADLIVHK